MDSAEGSSPSTGVCVFAPSTIVTVTVEQSGEDGEEAEVHFHAGGQGFWIARLLGRLAVPTTLCTVFGGESGRVAAALVESEPVEVRAVHRHDENGVWVHDRRTGDRKVIADTGGSVLRRHETDELVGATLVAALRLGTCVLAGPHRSELIAASHYQRMATDLRANGVEVIVDLSGAPLQSSLAGGVDFCKVSDEDLVATHGGIVMDRPLDALDQLCAQGAGHAVITRAADPTLAIIAGEHYEVIAPRFLAVDHRGAGDAFTALVAAARHWGLDWHDAIRWGVAAGALTVIRRGLATADRREIHQLLGRIELRSLDVA